MMNRSKWITILLTVFILTMSLGTLPVYAQSQEETEQAVIQIIADSEMFADWLAQFPGWVGHGYPADDGSTGWWVEFYNEDETEWLGYASIDAATGIIYESFAPKPLPSDIFQEQQPRIEEFVLEDGEVQGRLGNPDLWGFATDYNRWEAAWDVYFYRGVEAVLVRATIDENDNLYIDEILDPNELSEEQAEQNARDQAINLAYSAEGIDSALDGFDNWRTYVEHQGGTRWSVTFAADDQELFFALVDVTTDQVLEARAGE
jgi:hypothetical protein